MRTTVKEPDLTTALRIYEIMTTVRIADEQIRTMVMSGQATIAYYSPAGQEGIAAGIGAHLQPNDYLVTTYRGLHDQVAKGMPLPELFAEYLGKVTGACNGKGGPMHITHPASGVMVTTGVVGGGIPIANGLAVASQLRKSSAVTVCNFGDGATNIGAFHESMNLASLWALPVVFVCQNNSFAEHTTFANGTSVDAIVDRASSYRMAAISVNGNDPVAVWQAAGEAIARARAGEGPTLIEAMTYRFFGHYFGEDTHYMPAEELEAARTADPTQRFRAALLDRPDISEEDLATIDKAA